jgi:diguanylate cyclase (GGDEF)-like protein/PAS domain S-box-containing protein
MTTPMPEEERVPATMPTSGENRSRERAKLARKWAYLVSMTAYLPLSHAEIERELLELVNDLADAVPTEPLDLARASGVGARLVQMHCVGRTSLQVSVDVLAGALLADPELAHVDRMAERVTRLVGALASGYAEAIRTSALRQQDELNRALVEAVSKGDRSRKAGDLRFDQVLSGSDSGIAITDLDGRFERTNAAFDAMVNRSAEATFFDLIHAGDRLAVGAAYQEMLAGKAERLRLQPRLLLADGEVAKVALSASVLPGADGRPSHYLTIVADVTELSLLRGQLSHQLLHDVLTGLPNRQFFTTRLEQVLHEDGPMTVFQLDLDGFPMISDGLGRTVTESLLRTVGERLTAVMAGEKAMVAHFDGARFAILLEGAPDLVSTVGRITETVTRPVRVDGRDVATSVSIGAVHRPERRVEPAELLRSADMAVRQARQSGPGQWAVFDPSRDARDRATFGLAAGMPAAWRSGQIRVVYQPLVRLADRRMVGVEPLLMWNQPEHGSVPHDRCLELAERIGLIARLGSWLLRRAADQLRRSGRDLMLAVDLTPNQSADPELVARVLHTLNDTGLPPERLQLGMPVPELLTEYGHAAENLRFLAEAGIRTAIHDVGNLAADLIVLEELPIRAVRLSPRLISRAGRSTLTAKAVTDLAALVHSAEATLTVGGIHSQPQANWWHRTGADVATGPLFSTGPQDEISALSMP